MIVDSVLTNAKAYINQEIVQCSIAIDNGKIFKISKETHMPKSDKKIDLKNFLVLPGLIDPHVHLRDEGKSYKEDFYTGTAAAAAGGFTTVLDMPNNFPVTCSRETLKNRIKLAENRILVNVGFYSEFPRDLIELPEIVNEGAIAFKLFLAHQIGGLSIDVDLSLQEALTKVNELDMPFAVHAEDKNLLLLNEKKLKNSNKNDSKAFLKAHSEEVEYYAIERLLRLNEGIGAHLHFCHVSTIKGLTLIKNAKETNTKITCEVTPNHIFLSNNAFDRYGQLLIMMPPPRSENNVTALLTAIRNGWVDVLGSDHAPHTINEKMNTNVWDVKVGLPGLETSLPLMLTMVNKRLLTIGDIALLFSENPARIFKLPGLGFIEQGKNADLTVIDIKKKFKIDASSFNSKAKYSPYDGWDVQGSPVKTFVKGTLIMEEQKIIGENGSGSILKRVVQ